jgi:catechol 2,3-dioxygenase
MAYTIPPDTKIGHVHLKVADLDRALQFYRDLLGFELQQLYGKDAAFISAGGYHHHIGLNTWYSRNGARPARTSTGLFHGVSEANYLDDPDGNGVELYWDRPHAEWPRNEAGELEMITESLDLNALLALASED